MTILVIDDDKDDTELFCEAVSYLNDFELVSKLGRQIECIAVKDGKFAMDLLATSEKLPDFIFLDINMPVMGGKECLRRIKSDKELSNIPVVMLSTAVIEKDKAEFFKIGAVDCIKKPSSFQDLVKLLSKYVYSNLS